MRPRRHRRPVLRDGAARLLVLVLVLLLVPAGLTAQRAHFDSVASSATNVPDGFTVVAVGDVIIGRALTTRDDPGFRTVTELLRSGDVTFGNKEGSLIDLRSFDGHPQAEFGGAYHIAPPAVADDLRAMGFNLMGVANNHLLDWGVEGMRETLVHLDRAGIAHAGAGEDLGRAAAAGYLETPGAGSHWSRWRAASRRSPGPGPRRRRSRAGRG